MRKTSTYISFVVFFEDSGSRESDWLDIPSIYQYSRIFTQPTLTLTLGPLFTCTSESAVMFMVHDNLKLQPRSWLQVLFVLLCK